MKELLTHKKWFDRYTQRRLIKLLERSEAVELKTYPLFLTLPLLKELGLLSIVLLEVLLAVALLESDKVTYSILIPISVVISLGIYIIARKALIRIHYGEVFKVPLVVSRNRLEIPPVMIGQNQVLSVKKGDVELIKVYWHETLYTNDRENRVFKSVLNLRKNQKYEFSGFAFPLKSFFYLLIYYDYPIDVIEK
ncbi:hypothetical protein [Aliikangiella sp. IMCC44632]